jgi:hypothetical protein
MIKKGHRLTAPISAPGDLIENTITGIWLFRASMMALGLSP